MTVINVVELIFKALPEPMTIWDVKVRDVDVLFTWRGKRYSYGDGYVYEQSGSKPARTDETILMEELIRRTSEQLHSMQAKKDVAS